MTLDRIRSVQNTIVSLSLPYPWDFDITEKLPSDNDKPCLAPRDTSSLFGEIREESTD
jgi:hypothetical protein